MTMFFSKKKVEVDKTPTLVNQFNSEKRELIYDFIRILDQIQETNNSKYEKNTLVNFKKRQLIINNQTGLAIDSYRQKIMELDKKRSNLAP